MWIWHLVWACTAFFVYVLLDIGTYKLSRRLEKLPRTNLLFSWGIELSSDVRNYGHGLAILAAAAIVFSDMLGPQRIILRVATTYLIILGAVIAISGGNALEAWKRDRLNPLLDPRDRQFALTMWPLLINAAKYVIYFLSIMFICGAWGFDLVPMLAGIGVLGLVIGIGAQDLISDLLSGLFIIFERLFYAESEIEVLFIEGEGLAVSGTVERITWRITYIREPETGYIVAINNRELKAIRVIKK